MSQIPDKKHSKEELAELRAQKAMQMAGQQVVNPYNKKIAKKPVVIFGYICAMSAPMYLMILKFQDKFSYELSDVKIMLSCILLAIVVAAFIFFARNLSRHHASFIVIIAMISSFSIFYLVNNDEMLKRDVLSILGQEPEPVQSDADRIVEEALKRSADKPREEIKREVVQPKKESVTLTAEEKAEMERMFGPAEERSNREKAKEKSIERATKKETP